MLRPTMCSPRRLRRLRQQLSFVGAGLGLGLGLSQQEHAYAADADGGGAAAAAVGVAVGAATGFGFAYGMYGSAGSSTTSSSIVDAVGNTPLLELKSLSMATGRRIVAKAEYMNPGGSIKDRVGAGPTLVTT